MPRAEPEDATLGLAPLIDVVLLLLIFFVVTTSFAASRIPLELPGASSAEPPRAETLTIVLSADGSLHVNGEPADPARLALRLESAASGGAAVEVRADARVEHGHVVEVLDLARIHGIGEVGIAVAPEAPARTP